MSVRKRIGYAFLGTFFLVWYGMVVSSLWYLVGESTWFLFLAIPTTFLLMPYGVGVPIIALKSAISGRINGGIDAEA